MTLSLQTRPEPVERQTLAQAPYDLGDYSLWSRRFIPYDLGDYFVWVAGTCTWPLLFLGPLRLVRLVTLRSPPAHVEARGQRRVGPGTWRGGREVLHMIWVHDVYMSIYGCDHLAAREPSRRHGRRTHGSRSRARCRRSSWSTWGPSSEAGSRICRACCPQWGPWAQRREARVRRHRPVGRRGWRRRLSSPGRS